MQLDKVSLPAYDAFLIMYSVDSFSSYMAASALYERLKKQLSGVPPVCMFVALKTDLAQREVGREYGKELGTRFGVDYVEASAVTGAQVEETVSELVTQVLTQRKNMTAKELFESKKKGGSPDPVGAPLEKSASRTKESCLLM